MSSGSGRVRFRELPRNLAFSALNGLVRVISGALPPASRASLLGQLVEDISPQFKTNGLTFSVPGRYPFILVYRLKSKEPDTIAWIDQMAPGSVLWDVGANVGTFSIYAGSRGIRVCAFEPEAGSFAVLQRNIDLNRMHDRILALNAGLSDKSGLVRLRLYGEQVGLPKHAINDDQDGRQIVGMTGADLIAAGVPAPDYLKIDVDGSERRVLAGLRLDGVKELQIELRDNGDAEGIFERLAQDGFDANKPIADVKAAKGKAVDVLFRRKP